MAVVRRVTRGGHPTSGSGYGRGPVALTTAFLRVAARRALAEDRAAQDVTSLLFVPSTVTGQARIVAQAPGVLAGGPLAREVFSVRDSRVRARCLRPEGAVLRPGDRVLEAVGPLRALLSAERTALNFLTHLSGIASLTREYVKAAGRGGPAILETRKTIPGLRDLQKYAVRIGGGQNHRRDLSDAVLIKENHLAFFVGDQGRADLILRVRQAQRRGRPVEMECRDPQEVAWGLDAGADILLLDNVAPKALGPMVRWIREECLRRRRRAPLLEVSGGVTLKALPRLARSGVDRISVGRLTHSAPALDMSLDVVPV